MGASYWGSSLLLVVAMKFAFRLVGWFKKKMQSYTLEMLPTFKQGKQPDPAPSEAGQETITLPIQLKAEPALVSSSIPLSDHPDALKSLIGSNGNSRPNSLFESKNGGKPSGRLSVGIECQFDPS